MYIKLGWHAHYMTGTLVDTTGLYLRKSSISKVLATALESVTGIIHLKNNE